MQPSSTIMCLSTTKPHCHPPCPAAAPPPLPHHPQDCEILYVAFDILFVQDQAVSKTMKLEERYGLLERFVVADGEAGGWVGGSCVRCVVVWAGLLSPPCVD